MCSKGLFRRILPFFATFAVGLFIASFFVDISAPKLGRGRFARHEFQRVLVENEQLRNENLRLRNELDDSRFGSGELRHNNGEEFVAPDVNLPVPLPPAPPRVRR